MRTALRDMIREASRHAEYACLAGEDDRAYDDLADELRAALAEVRMLRAHAHQWDGNDVCRICGADGRA